ncbi:PREDICTED: venom serine protease 34-like [Ceratosolen solmsi marchali]|uniref:Venom serine protease 34-like n=1 Tax=Ceratosolen solmsi marchali TaxID=326594 RepID=A0AAJ7E2T0_9HYME|nr:PREDICTED: venom serine protease 34-like [Ceratosolen solmsi marchali]
MTVFSAILCKNSRIIGGEIVNIVEYPFMAFLRIEKTGELICGGVIISNYHILTSAVCIKKTQNDKVVIKTGSTSSKSIYGPTYQIDLLFIHPDFTEDDTTTIKLHDFGVIKLKGHIQFDQVQSKLRLPVKHLPDGINCIILGWGLTSFPFSTISLLLRKGLTKTISNDDCSRIRGVEIHRNLICISTSEEVSANFGDRGGPLLSTANEFIGIASSIEPSSGNIPNIYIRIYPYLDFIRSVIIN